MFRREEKIIVCVILCVIAGLSTVPIPMLMSAGEGETGERGYCYPALSTIVPMGPNQTAIRGAYKSTFSWLSQGVSLQWSVADVDYEGTTYSTGSFLSKSALSGPFTWVRTTEEIEVPGAYALTKRNIYIFNSKLTDSRGQPITWEYLYFRSLFETYLWGNYLNPVDELDIGAGSVTAPNILIIPAIAPEFVELVKNELGASGLLAIANFVNAGGTLIAQGDSCWLAEAAGLVPIGTVQKSERVTANNNTAILEVMNADSPLTFSWLVDEIYLLDDPLLSESVSGSAVAVYSDGVSSEHIGSPAILSFQTEKGRVVLTAGHPSEQAEQFPMVLDAVLLGCTEVAELRNSITQTYTPELPWYLIPGYEKNITMNVTGCFSNFKAEQIEGVNIMDYIRSGFWVDENSIDPAPEDVTVEWWGTIITWNFTSEPGDFDYRYTVLTGSGGVTKGYKTVTGSWAFYIDPETGREVTLARDGLWMKSSMAARLFGDRDIELDGVYPLPADGFYFDMAFPIENKEDTSALNSVCVDIVPLVSPVVDVEDQTHICNATGNTNFGTNDPVWIENTIFFYDNPNYPLPDGVTDPMTRFTRTDADCTYIYNATGTPIVLPAKRLQWTIGTIGAYDHHEPWIRYGIFSQEEFHRTVSHESDPIPGSVILEGSGGSVYTALGCDSIPYHEYLQSGITYMPEYPEPPRVDYEDVWHRPHVLELRTVFFDIVPFPPPEEHAVISSTYEMRVDSERYLEFPMDSIADLDVMIQSYNGYPPYDPINYPYHMDMIRNETLIRQAIPKGLGYDITYLGSDFSANTEIADIVETDTHIIVYYRQDLNASCKETIMVHNTLENRDHDEGTFKVNDGARFVYRQIAVGPSRYEVHDNHVQVVWGVRNDVELTNKVSPVSVATYEDEVYQVLTIKDPYEPEDLIDPYIKSYGFGNISATTFVGGRINDTLLSSKISVGERTLIRIEIDNNLGYDLTDVSVVPGSHPGFDVTPRWFDIPPIWYDFPFLDVPNIWDAWKGVYYFDVTALPGVEEGKIHRIDFTLEGDNVPEDFIIPEALVAVLDGSGHAYMSYGTATSLSIEQTLPSYVSLTGARLANATEKAEFETVLATGDDLMIELAYLSLREMDFTITLSGSNNVVTYELPPEATTLPWNDNGEESMEFHVVTRSEVAIQTSGKVLYTWAPKVTYIDHFGRTKRDWGGAKYVAAHGPALAAQPIISQIKVGSVKHTSLIANAENDVWVDVYIANIGDDVAVDPEVLITLPVGVGVVDADPAWTSFDSGSGEARWDLSDIAPYARPVIKLKLHVQPPTPLYNYEPFTLLRGIQPEFTHLYLGLSVQSSPLGPPALQAPNRIDADAPNPPTLDQVTSPTATSPVIISGVSEPEAQINVFVNGVQAATTITDAMGIFSTLVILEEGNNEVTATAFDQFDNGPSLPSSPLTIKLDTTPPDTPEIFELASPTSDTQITIQGRTEHYSTVEISLNGQLAGKCQANSYGMFSMELQLVEGENLIMARACDFLGNGPGPWSPTKKVWVDLTAPQPPKLDPLPSMVSAEELCLSGRSEPGAEIEIEVNGIVEGTVTADDTGFFIVNVPISEGENNITIWALDSLGNGPGGETKVVVLRDTIAPSILELDSIESPTSQTIIWVSGVTEPNATVEVLLGEVWMVTTTADSSGKFVVLLPLAEGENLITAKTVDQAGNIGLLSQSLAVFLDTTPPEAKIDFVSPEALHENIEITLIGSGIDSGRIVSYRWTSNIDGELGDESTIKTKLSHGTHQISFMVQDETGHWSQSAQIEVKVEKTERAEDTGWSWTIIAIIIITAIAVAVFVGIRRVMRKSKNTSLKPTQRIKFQQPPKP